MIQRFLKLLGVLFFGAIYAILGLLGVAALSGLAVACFLQSSTGIIVFVIALTLVVIIFASIVHKPTRARIGNSKNCELPLLLFGVTGGTFAGMILSTALLLLGDTQLPVATMLVCSVFVPVSAMLLERIGLLDIFDVVDLIDFFDD